MKIILQIEYDGTRYFGWQIQKNTITIQEKLELAISKIANQKIRIVCAGRTDTGVHSIGQIIHFVTNVHRSIKSWIIGVNSYLPKDIVVICAWFSEDCFHARHSAISRRYQYIIYNYPIRSAIVHNRVFHFYRQKLDEKKMNQAALLLLGTHDFSVFRAKNCQSKNPIKTIKFIQVYRINKFVFLDIEANSFLYHMVRNIMGTLLIIGLNKKKVSWIKKLLKLKKRLYAGPTMPASGLYLTFVQYPKSFNITKWNTNFNIFKEF
ncbi:tRNA pseudouridine(38-40) synthase TruA [Buchnera aphidicola (Thelaxes californica)]|uniref:tRNA pseudouridine synthase A n=1 Tax=Buchnera aphidicola (Thelaxes californica) TaxID=1315998 RepID=A0A4D6YCC3_9GAMM|nr:tRNA pseudouridine(38-40) synthase TruA [Buchnera aphidicola (Thelaxes californica)]